MAEGITSKAAILEELGKSLVISDVELPALDCGQVLVRVHASGICGTQIGEMQGDRGPDPYLPHLLGHEGGGVVEEVGPGVKYVKPGDHVIMHWRKGIGIESVFPKYKRDKEVIGGGLITTFNEYAIVSENRLTKIKKDIPFDIASLMGCCVTTGLGLVNNEAKLKIGQSIAILGCGGVGLNVIQGARMVSANPIVAMDKIDFKLELAKKCGATHIVNPDPTYRFEGFDVFVECTGLSELIALAHKQTAIGGKTILVGLPQLKKEVVFPQMLRNLGKKLMWSHGGLTNPTEDIPRYLNLYKQGILKLDHLITHRFKLEQINEAIETVKGGDCGKVVLEMG